MSKHVFFDLDTNKELEGNFFGCNIRLIDPIIALMKNGYNIIDCKLDDNHNIYSKEQDVLSNLSEGKVLEEGKNKGEYRRITYKDSKGVRYDSFKASDTIEIKMLGTYNFQDIPKEYEVINVDNYTIIRVPIPKITREGEYYGQYEELDITSAIEKFNTWVENIIGEKIEHQELPQNSYGNSEYAIDCKSKKVINKDYIVLDYLIFPVIQQLREKGYKTIGCCSGHYDSIFVTNASIIPNEQNFLKFFGPWIAFPKDENTPEAPADSKIEEVGKIYKVSYNHNLKGENGFYKPTSLVKLEIEESISKMQEWVKALPPVERVKKI